MRTMITLLTCLMLTGCAGMAPIDMGFEVSALGGLIKVKPEFSIGDGKVGPTSVAVEVAGEEDESP